MKEYLEFSKSIAKKAGKLLLEYYHEEYKVESKDDKSLVSEADHASNKLILDEICSKYPDHGVFSEESERKDTSEYLWIVDPLDGTHNYVAKNPLWCVSIALVKNEEVLMGIIYHPLLDEMFWATRGNGAYLNGKRISCTKKTKLSECTIGITVNAPLRDKYFYLIEKFWPPRSKRLRILGSSATILSYIACGRLDAYIHPKENPWDHAAGGLIVHESGGKITTYPDQVYNVFEKGIITSNQIVHEEISKEIKDDT